MGTSTSSFLFGWWWSQICVPSQSSFEFKSYQIKTNPFTPKPISTLPEKWIYSCWCPLSPRKRWVMPQNVPWLSWLQDLEHSATWWFIGGQPAKSVVFSPSKYGFWILKQPNMGHHQPQRRLKQQSGYVSGDDFRPKWKTTPKWCWMQVQFDWPTNQALGWIEIRRFP